MQQSLWSAALNVSTRVFLATGFFLGVVSFAAGVGYLAREALDPRGAVAAIGSAVPPPLKHEWALFRGKHWQIASAAAEPVETTDALEGTRDMCARGMVEVRGAMKLDPSSNPYDGTSIEDMQKTTCTKWINKEYPERCAEFDRARWLAMSAELSTRPMHFCIDRFEYPNQRGQYPILMVTWHEAVSLCDEQGKRLCDEAEWTFACEGEEATPYPYGYVRDAEACVVDRRWRPYNDAALRRRDGYPAMLEMDKLWQGAASGMQPRCRSAFGVYDMTGNVDEWTRSAREGERPSILKGGYWGPVRTRCRPSTRSHDENHAFYQQSFRCCADVGKAIANPAAVHDPAAAPLPREIR